MTPQAKYRYFEATLSSVPIHDGNVRIKILRSFMNRVWADLKLSKPAPTLSAGNGVLSKRNGKSEWASYEQGGHIVLARHHRCKLILLHEMAHYIADDPPPYHCEKFLKCYKKLIYCYMPQNVVTHAKAISRQQRNSK